MELIKEFESKSAPKIKKAASKIFKQKLAGYEEYLLSALTELIEKPKSWKVQSEIIRALGVSGGEKSLSYLKQIVSREYEASVLYRDLAFSICLLNDISKSELDYAIDCVNSSNEFLLSGVCAAILYSGYLPKESEITKIISAVENIDENEGQTITPRTYIAAACYTWPPNLTKEFLQKCIKSSWVGLVEIATDSLAGKRTKYVLI